MSLTTEQKQILQLEQRFFDHDYSDGTRRRLIEQETGLDEGKYLYKLRVAIGDEEARELHPGLFGKDGRPLVNLTGVPSQVYRRQADARVASDLQFREPTEESK